MFNNGDNIFEMSVKEFANSIDGKNNAIPAFQREYVWGKKVQKILNLLDSIYNGFNLGTVVLWESKTSAISRPKQNLNYEENNDGVISYIVDGQQRTLTLVSLFTNHNVVDLKLDAIHINIDRDSEKLEFSKTASKTNPTMTFKKFRSEILNKTEGMFEFEKEYSGFLNQSELIEAYEREILTLKSKISAKPIVIGYKLQVGPKKMDLAIKQFERINEAGIKLSEFDILDAMAYSDGKYKLSDQGSSLKNNHLLDGVTKSDGKFTSDSIKIISNTYKLMKNFKDTEQVSLSASAISNFKPGDSEILKNVISLYKNALAELKALNLASIKDVPWTHNITLYMFIKSMFGDDLSNMSDGEFLYSIMVQTGLQKSYDKSASQQLIRHIKEVVDQLNTDAAKIVLKDSHVFEMSTSIIKNTSYKTISAMEKAIFLYWINHKDIVDYKSGSKVKFDGIFKKSKNFDHIFPKSKHEKTNPSDTHCIANIAIVEEGTNKDKSALEPSEYFDSIPFLKHSKMYRTHSIEEDSWDLLIDDSFVPFVNARAKKIATDLKDHMDILWS